MRSTRYEMIDGEGEEGPVQSNSLNKFKLHSTVNTIGIAILVFVIAFQYHEIGKLNEQYGYETTAIKEHMHKLEHKVLKLSDNTSTAYIIQSVKDLREDVQDYKSELNANMQNTQTLIDQRLDSTAADLDVAVADAKEVIKAQVEEVRDDMAIYISITNQQLSAESDFIKYEIAGTFTLLACLISMWHIWGHLRHLGKPSVQRRVLAILWMVPIYSITSWLSLVFPGAEVVLSALRDCYEAYVVYTFMALLIAILGEDKGVNTAVTVLANHISEERVGLREELLEEGFPGEAPTPHHHVVKPPFSCYDNNNPRSVAAAVLDQCQALAMQFVLIKPLLAALPFLIEAFGVPYEKHSVMTEDHSIDWTAPKLYVLFILNVSVGFAFFGLMSFYHATEVILAWCDPWPKFICIKGIVFMTFWQGIAITGMGMMGVVDEKNALAAQNILICIEMLLASIMHHLFFPYQEWEEGYKKSKEHSLVKLRDTLALKDFVSDVKGMIYRRAWEGVHQSGQSPGGPVSGDHERLSDDEIDDVVSIRSFDSAGSDKHYLSAHNGERPRTTAIISGVLEPSFHDGAVLASGSTGVESSIELIESVLNDVMLSHPEADR